MDRTEAPVRAVWITWERQRRNEGIARALGVPLYELNVPGSRLRRYMVAVPKTATILRTERPEVVFVQNPSIVLGLGAVIWGRLARVPVFVDAHNAGLDPHAPPQAVLRRIAALIARLARFTIVSNANLSPIVESYGGRPFVLPDPIPELPDGTLPAAGTGLRVLFICSYASDEPYEDVIEAARRLGPEVTVWITGNPKDRRERLLAMAPPNVVLTGFLSEADFVGLMRAADVVMDLTTRDDCLVCGAYEGLAAGKALVLSDSAATRAYFSQGVVYTRNDVDGITASLRQALAERERLAADAVALRERLLREWDGRRTELLALMRKLARRNGDAS
jgi:glycosyltransferase involved in cell wall biosynthesis